jgi:serine/threonine-protein kinase HipA
MFKAKMAMAVLGKNKHYHFIEIQRRHFNHMAAKCFSRKDAETILEFVLERVPNVIEAVGQRLPVGFPELVAQSIFAGLQRSAERLAAMAKA